MKDNVIQFRPRPNAKIVKLERQAVEIMKVISKGPGGIDDLVFEKEPA